MKIFKDKNYYYILIVFAVFCLAFVGQGVANGTKSQYIKPICDMFGWARTEFSLGMSIGDLMMFFGNVFFVVAVTKLKGVRNVFLVGCVALVGAFAIFFNAASLPVFYVGWILFGLSQAYINTASYSVIVNNWFSKKNGTMLGLVFAGTGVGSIVWNLVVGYALQNQSWRQGYLYSLIAVVVLGAIALLILRNKPSDVKMKPYGADKAEITPAGEHGGKADTKPIVFGFTLKEVLKEPFYWIAGLAIAMLIMSIMGVFLNTPGFLGNEGFSSIKIASVISASFVSATIGKIFGGMAIDKFGIKKVLIFTIGSFVIATTILANFSEGDAMTSLYAFIVFFGFSLVAASVCIPMVARSLFGNKDFAAIMGTVMAFFSLGGILAAPSGTLVYDMLKTYVPAFIGYIIISIVALGLLLWAMSMSAKKIKMTNKNIMSPSPLSTK